MEKKKVLFLTSDDDYAIELNKNLNKISDPAIVQIRTINQNPSTPFSLLEFLHEIQKVDPRLIILDTSFCYHALKKAIYFLSLGHPWRLVPLLVVQDSPFSKEQIQELLTSRVMAFNVKSIDQLDILTQVLFLLGIPYLPKVAHVPWKKEKKGKKEKNGLFASNLMRVGYMTDQYIHIESGLDLPLERPMKMHLLPFAENGIDSFKVIRKMDENIYYPFKFAYDLTWDFVPPSRPPERTESLEKSKNQLFYQQVDISNRTEEYVQRLKNCEQHLAAFMKKSESKDGPKRTRVLIVDSKLSVLHESKKDLDQYPFSLRVCSNVDEKGEIIRQVKAGIIAIVMDEDKNNLTALASLSSAIRGIPGYSPIVIVFNCKYLHSYVSSKMENEKIIVDKGDFNFDLLFAYSTLYEEKKGREKTHDKKYSYGHLEKRIYFHKGRRESFAELELGIIFHVLTEAYALIESQIPLPEYTKLSVNWPLSMHLLIVPFQAKRVNGQDFLNNSYLALIFGLDESGKKAIRVFINKTIQENMGLKEDL